MRVNFKLDSSEFQSALKEYLNVTSKDTFEAINHVAGDVALRAASFTPKSNSGKIRSDLNRPVSIGGRSIPLGFAIINANQRKLGKKAVYGKAMGNLFRNLILRRIRSIGFLRSGWAQCAMDLGKSYRGRPRTGSRLGKATKATRLTQTATLYYLVPEKQSQKSGSQIISIAIKALSDAIEFKTQDMLKRIMQVYEKRSRQYSAK